MTTDMNPASVEWQRLISRPAHELAAIEPGRSVTVAGLVEAVGRRAGQLVAHGVSQGNRVVVARPNTIEFVVDYLAVRRLGAVLVNLPWSSRNLITRIAESVDAACVVLHDGLVAGDPVFDVLAGTRFRSDRAVAIAPLEPVGRSLDDLAWLACTSGTSGSPKAAVHTEWTFDRHTEVFAQRFDLDATDAILVASPVGHAVGLLFGVRLALFIGAPMALVPRWSPGDAADLTEQARCTFTVAPTPFLMDVVANVEQHGRHQWQTLRHFPSGGAPVPRSLLERANVALPGTEIWSYYGSSEAGPVTAMPADATKEQRFDTDGVALPGVHTRVVEGELQVKGAQMALGYWGGDPEGRFRPDGWYATGDQATQDELGFIRLTGRAQDLILRGGENISSIEIENTLLQHPAITDVSVVGVEDDRLGARVAAVIVTRHTVTLDDVREFCSTQGLAKSKWPEHLVITAEIPRSIVGKVIRADVEILANGVVS
ncbi:MAG: AMP-binding protein [Ilumatobacteraceae bacterium]